MTSNNLVIFTYTRAQALADGFLIDVSSKLAREASFRYPVALTTGVWAECVAVPEGVTGQDETGRLWDILNMLRFATLRQKGDGERIDFALHVRNDNREGEPPLVSLYALCGPGDNGEPVITVLLPGED